MKQWLCALGFALMPLLSTAAPVKVTSGEHEGFTRLVMEYAGPVDWTVGRALDGYGLGIEGESPLYDLSGVFDIIGKSRLASIWVDPETRILRIGIACACHVIPFEFRPGIVVLDLKDGPPPNGSSFELALADQSVNPLAPRPNPRPRLRPNPRPRLQPSLQPNGTPPARNTVAPYDWLASLPPQRPKPQMRTPEATAILPPDPLAADLTLQPLRDQLLRQLSRGAAQGMIEMALPEAMEPPRKAAKFASAQVRIGAMPGIGAGTGLPEHAGLAADGRACASAEALDLASWGDARPAFEQMAGAMAGLTGEFDRPNPEAVKKAIRFNLFMGFGAEATQLSQAFPLADADSALWQSLARLIDDEPDPAGVFADQADCDTPAALWAILAATTPGTGDKHDAKAALLAFSALPVHLRRHLGARLADRFMALGEVESARAVRDAILRAPGSPGAEVDLLQARMDLEAGDPQAAEQRAETVLANAGPNAGEALITLTESRVAQMLPVEPSVVSALEAMAMEQKGTPDAPRYQRALVLAQAASGDFAAAIAQPETPPETARLVWALLANIGEDAALLNHAVLADTAELPPVDEAFAAQIGGRLIALGFPEQALRWMTPQARFDPLLVAQAQLMLHDAGGAMLTLADQTSTEALMMRAGAQQILGENAVAAATYASAGDPEAGWRATGRALDWQKLARSGPDPWKRAAASTLTAEDAAAIAESAAGTPEAESPPAPAPEGPLARSRRLADGSAATRDALDVLLAAVPFPAADSQ